MTDALFLCQQDEISTENDCKGMEITLEGRQLSLFLVRSGEQIYGYQNRCPHTGIELNWMPDQFLDLDGRYIQCSVHGALFRIEDGYCLRGPCLHQRLTPLELSHNENGIYLKNWPRTER